MGYEWVIINCHTGRTYGCKPDQTVLGRGTFGIKSKKCSRKQVGWASTSQRKASHILNLMHSLSLYFVGCHQLKFVQADKASSSSRPSLGVQVLGPNPTLISG